MRHMNDCLFCKIIKGEIPSQKLYEDENTYVFLDIGPVSRGHALIIPKEHAPDIHSGSEEAALAMMGTLYKIVPKLLNALGATGYNLGMNHGAIAGQEVFHTHLHVMPRYEGQPREFVKSQPSQEELAEVAEQIRKGLTT